MSDMRAQLIETATALLTANPSASAFDEAGFGQLLVPEAQGGFGGDWGDACAVLFAIGYHAPALNASGMITAPAGGDTLQDGALTTVALIAGAVQRILELSIDYANTRVQFGKPLSKQQAVQQLLASLAEEAAAVAVAVQAAAASRDAGGAALEIAAAKLRANRAAGIGAAISHQVHGAIGFTQDHALHHYTRQLAVWRSTYGNEAHWAAILGAHAISLGGRGLWEELTCRSDALI
jgi:acyl-CoA dehydrogenase